MSKILIAEDEESLRHLLTRQLVRSNHEVTPVENGELALLALEKEPFDLVITDMKMPRLDGMGLLREARAREISAEFVILTGHGSLEGAVEAFKSGNVVDYLLKPLDDIRVLGRIVDKALETRRLKAENARLLEEMTRMALEDGLTGLLNYRGIHDRLEKLVAHGNEPLSVVLLDLDNFKFLNDHHGHPFGDRALREVARILRAAAGPSTPLGRCGGDEFMMLLPGLSQAEAVKLIETVRTELARQPLETPSGNRIPFALCFGVVDAFTVGHDSARLVAAADAALYQSKRSGGNQVTAYNPNPSVKPTSPLTTLTNHLDTFTREHSEEMTELAVLLAEQLGLDEATRNAVQVAGLLHDIGKIAVPEAILMKPAALTPDEYQVVRQHVHYSTQIAQALPNLSLILSGVTHHHERWDGCGYPNGLSGTEIPLIGRLLAVTDAYSAMISNRPYRAPLTPEEALSEIERGAGEQFDPLIAEAFVTMLQRQQPRRFVESERSAEEIRQLPRAV